mmetsp:Transcript_14472/g.37532  ORF Transcript_14472/g.37532 Transcript_14472/m.37532 type:complete len:219 (+) Transcript_14472:21-677(+)|eukprot:CAMPEP_0115860676 /NCGR_PEP_ID=MMETSP0287-20121206/17251_1 /TAXON_ID=412157 /ORGANISM="Chrysochromulina rotalis, Strain UIO044" /LENGTH=218 /DNA_ID=CAMNT_0003315009 /DNA_START=21 /DNA_END=677 /DNA_ORIENTATION=+
MGGGGGDDIDDGRWVPSPNDHMLNYQQAVDSEDRIRILSWSQKQKADAAIKAAMEPPTKHPVGRQELLSFAQRHDWKAAAKDPATKAAMQRVRDRVASLKEEGMHIFENRAVKPNAGTRLLNQRVRVPVEHEFFMSSSLNPLEASYAIRGWDTRVRPWPGETMLNPAERREPTSFWCESWGGCASDKALDTGMTCVRPQDITPYAKQMKSTLHGKAFR